MDDLYTDLAADYEWLFSDDVVGSSPVLGATSPGGRDLLEAAVAALAPGASVLDCACGVGVDALALARMGLSVTASDGSPSMVARARERLASYQVSVLSSRWEDLPAKLTERFDLAICLGNAIVHTGSKPQMIESLRAIREVLKPDAAIVVDSRNWELIYTSWPRIVPATHARERGGTSCVSLYVWTVPGNFDRPCQAEIVFLFENQARELSHRRYELTFRPFTHVDLRQALQAAGFQITGDSFEPTAPFYAITAVASAGGR